LISSNLSIERLKDCLLLLPMIDSVQVLVSENGNMVDKLWFRADKLASQSDF